MRLLPHELYLANLQGEFHEGMLGYMTQEKAHAELVRCTGQDFGMDIGAWKAWISANRPKAQIKIRDPREAVRLMNQARRQATGNRPKKSRVVARDQAIELARRAKAGTSAASGEVRFAEVVDLPSGTFWVIALALEVNPEIDFGFDCVYVKVSIDGSKVEVTQNL
jgi:hypothetical protein